MTRTCKKQIHLLAPSGALYYNTLEHENRSPHCRIREYITAFKEFSKEFLERRGLARCGEGIGGTLIKLRTFKVQVEADPSTMSIRIGARVCGQEGEVGSLAYLWRETPIQAPVIL